jgi:hypothetical protein
MKLKIAYRKMERYGGGGVQAHCFESSQIRCHNKDRSTKLRQRIRGGGRGRRWEQRERQSDAR